MSAKIIMLTAMCALGITGCATSGMTVTEQGAPITYKLGQGGTQYASLPRGHDAPRPRFSAPSRLPEASRPREYNPVGGQGPDFDPSKVDRQLYAHQKVGRRYTIMGKSYTPRHEPDYDTVGTASWYGPKFHGKPTATGEIFNMRDMTAAHQTLPLNSMLYVTNMQNGRAVMVRLNDRGPFIGNRILDLSEAAAETLGFKSQGTAQVRIVYAGPADPMAAGRSVPRMAPRPAPMPHENMVERPAPPQPIPSPAEPYRPAPTRPAPAPQQQMPPRRPVAQAPSLPTPPPPRAAQELHNQPSGPEVGENVTLTIKGPIHIARSDEDMRDPEFIQGGIVMRPPER